MKIMIPEGQNWKEALRQIEKYLDENAKGFDMLQMPMHVDISLCNSHADGCSLNGSNLVLKDGNLIDKEKDNRQHAIEYCTKIMQVFLKKIQKEGEKREKDLADKIEKCLDEGRIDWDCIQIGSTHFGVFEPEEIYIRPYLDKNREILDEPLYCYEDGFSKEDKWKRNWIFLYA